MNRFLGRLWAAALWPLTWLYRLANWVDRRRKLAASQKIEANVISVGNLTVGGSGKTPFVIWLAGELARRQARPVVSSRGYRSKWEAKGGLVSGGHQLLATAAQAGDEPVLVADRLAHKGIPVIVGKERTQALKQHSPGGLAGKTVILDDGFQHYKLRRDFDIVLCPYRFGDFRDFLTLPAGPLREHPSHLARADIVVLTKLPAARAAREAFGARWRRYAPGAHFFTFETELGIPYRLSDQRPIPWEELESRPVAVVTGLADSTNFLSQLAKRGLSIQKKQNFSDHYSYKPQDIREALEGLEKQEQREPLKPLETRGGPSSQTGLSHLVVTEKDAVKIRELELSVELLEKIVVVPLTGRLDDPNALFSILGL